MSKKDDLLDFFNKHTAISRKEAIDQVIGKFKVTETTAETYYADWRREFMKTAPTTKEELKKEVVEDKLKYTTKKNLEENKEPKLNTEAPKKIQLIPIMFKGPVFTYQINESGVKIVDGESDIVTEEIVLEQSAAIEKYKEIYGNK